MALKLTMFPMEQSNGFVMRLAANRMKSGLNRAFQAANLEMTAEQWSVLAALRQQDGLSQTDLAATVTKDRQTMTRILDLLESGGHVQRRPHPNDRRCNLVFITTSGLKMQQKLTDVAEQFTEHAFIGLTQEDLDQLMRISRIVAQNINDMDPEALFGPGKAKQIQGGGR